MPLRLKRTALALALSFSTLAAFGVQASEVPAKVQSAIQQQINKIAPNAPKAKVEPSPIKGLYQVTMGPMVVYMSGDGRYLVQGNIIDLTTRTNLTEAAKAKAIKAEIAKIPESSMIIYPAKGEKKHTITVFTDIDCPYCHKLHKEVPKLNAAGIEVRYLSYPRAGIGSKSYDKAVSVWCAKDRAKAMTDAMQGKITPKTCKNTVANQYELSQLFNLNGTPAIILEDGSVIPGYVPAEKLIAALNQKGK